MKETPLLMNGEMVRATLAGLKTNTRRLDGLAEFNKKPDLWVFNKRMDGHHAIAFHKDGGDAIPVKCPFGQPGDRLWVRETHAVFQQLCDGISIGTPDYVYKADDNRSHKELNEYARKISDKNYSDYRLISRGWVPSIHMPRAACRILLTITDIRIERVQDITPYDACCEGVLVELPPVLQGKQIFPDGFDAWSEGRKDEWFESTARANYIAQTEVMRKLTDGFRHLWDSIYAKRGMGIAANPWVWVVTFKMIDKD